MTQTANRRRKVLMPMDIKKKFAAAICMLLIAAIMMISSTYAWFTLSTAPEVTGITTNVGANGNLEIALLTGSSFASNRDDLGIQTAVGDSMSVANKPKTESNITWGNLVDLDDPSYGLEKIVLNPAALNIKPLGTENADKLSGQIIQGGLTSPLVAPNYGADGRVINVQKATTTGVYNNNKFEESLTGAGVRAVGVSSGITARVSAYRKAVSQITVNMSAAKAAAQSSLVDNGQALASLLVTAVANDQYQLTADDVAAINAVKTALTAANTKIADGIKQAALAYYLSAANTAELTDAQVAEKVTAFEEASLSGLTALADPMDISFLNTAIAAHDAAQTKIDGVEVSVGQTYNAMATQISKLLDKDNALINGLEGSNLSSEDFGSLASAIIAAGHVEVTMLEGSGIYADFAKMVGNYTASGLRVTVEYNGIAVNDMPTVMTTSVTGTAMLTTASQTAAGGDPLGAGGSTAVDDTYGYMLDFGFRTNAAGSSLLLQQDVKQRIYETSAADITKGAGSFIEFTTLDRNVFSRDDVTALMSAVRIVFVTPNDAGDGYEILAVAAPNLKTSIDGSGVRSVTAADTDLAQGVSETNSDSDNSTTVSALLYLYDLNDIAVEELTPDKEYMMTLGKIKLEDPNATGTDKVADFAITSLEQNKAKKVSALVYIDGDIVDNTMVANAATTMSGKLNLQFASSAELVPMENTALRGGEGGNGGSQQTPSITKEQLSAAITTIKANDIYTTAAAAAEPTAEQTALLNAVTAAEAVVAYDEATAEQINNAATDLASKAQGAGITIAFGG